MLTPAYALTHDGVPAPRQTYSSAIRAGGWTFVAGQMATDFVNALADEAIAANPIVSSRFSTEGEYALRNIAELVDDTGETLADDVVLSRAFFRDLARAPRYDRDDAPWRDGGAEEFAIIHRQHVRNGSAHSPVGVRRLMAAAASVEVDAILLARAPNEDDLVAVEKQGPFEATARRRGEWTFATAGLRAGDGARESVADQTRVLLELLDVALEKVGGSLSKTAKAEVFLPFSSDFTAFDRAWQHGLGSTLPARTVVSGTPLALGGARVEVNLMGLSTQSGATPLPVNADDVPRPLGGAPHAVRAGDLLLFSELLPLDESGGLAEGLGRDPGFPYYGLPARSQMHALLDRAEAICEAAGGDLSAVVKRTCYHSDFDWFAEAFDAWVSRFGGLKPASTTVETGPLLVPGANTMLDLTAWMPVKATGMR